MAAATFRGVFLGAGADGMGLASTVSTISRLAGKPVAELTVLYVGTATYDSVEAKARQTDALARGGARIVPVLMSQGEEEAAPLFASADCIVVSGGNTLFAVDRWRYLGWVDLFREAAQRGAVLSGGSAGAICWFDAGHSDSADPMTFRQANPKLTEEEKRAWEYICVPGLGYFGGVLCPHFDRVQSNGVLRADDFDKFIIDHNGGGVGIGIDHFAGLVAEGDGSFSVLSPADQTTRTGGRPGVYRIEVVDGKPMREALPPTGKLADYLVPASGPSVLRDPRCDAIREKNPAEGDLGNATSAISADV